MDFELEPGMIVKTKFGEAKVIRTTRDGIYAQMQSGVMKGKNLSIPFSVIEGMVKSDNKPVPTPVKVNDDNAAKILKEKVIKNSNTKVPPAPKKITDTGAENVSIPIKISDEQTRIYKHKCIDALRFGLVPHEYISDLTIGFSSEEKSIVPSFPSSSDTMPQKIHQVTGQFGEGKSHKMSLIRDLAVKNGYIVGRIEVDGKRITLADPKMLNYSIMNSLKGNNLNKVQSILDLYLKSINNGHDCPKIYSQPDSKDKNNVEKIYQTIEKLNNHDYIESFDYILHDVLTCSDDRTANEACNEIYRETNGRLSEDEIKFNQMISWSLIDRPRNFLESIIGATLIAKQAGYKGFIITIDEYEVEETLRSGRQNEEKAKKLIDLMQQYILGKTAFTNAPLGIYIATVPSSKTSETDKRLSLHDLIEVSGGKSFKLKPFSGWNRKNLDLVEFVRKVHTMYIDVYGCSPLDEKKLFSEIDKQMVDLDLFESGGIRSFMKRFVEFLDVEYGPPSPL